jgi:hypothetical protein
LHGLELSDTVLNKLYYENTANLMKLSSNIFTIFLIKKPLFYKAHKHRF